MKRAKKEKFENQTYEIISKMHDIIPEAYRMDDSTTNLLKWVLPFSAQNKFSMLFTELEKFPDLQVCEEKNF